MPGNPSTFHYSTNKNPNETQNNNETVEALEKLAKGLIEGDAAHSGRNYSAGESAVIAMAEFADWWHRLTDTTKEKIYNADETNRLGAILKKFFGEEISSHRVDQITYAADINGYALSDICNNESIRKTLSKITLERKEIPRP